MIKISQLQGMDIINCTDGRYLGSLGDIEIDLNTGKIQKIFFNAPIAGSWRKKREPMEAAWQEIKKIGCDVILIETHGQLQMPKGLLEEHNPR